MLTLLGLGLCLFRFDFMFALLGLMLVGFLFVFGLVDFILGCLLVGCLC